MAGAVELAEVAQEGGYAVINPLIQRCAAFTVGFVSFVAPAARAQLSITTNEPVSGRFNGREGEKHSYKIDLKKDAGTIRVQVSSPTTRFGVFLVNRRDQYMEIM